MSYANVVCVEPDHTMLTMTSYVATPLLKNSSASEVMQREIERTPAGRIAEMEEIADTITFMVSPMSSFMYGAGLVADG